MTPVEAQIAAINACRGQHAPDPTSNLDDAAEERKATKRGDYMSERDQDALAERRAG